MNDKKRRKRKAKRVPNKTNKGTIQQYFAKCVPHSLVGPPGLRKRKWDDEPDGDMDDDVREDDGLDQMEGSGRKKSRFEVDMDARTQMGDSKSITEKSHGSKTQFTGIKRKLNGLIKGIREENPRGIGVDNEEIFK